ncbi:nuclear transport factor 2 family protein [Dactylosporangium sp. NPDC051484]|uniref:nuclear transport factor 2 family protein n=1 Tax=Dactylosporangium sp. NPDC051484 TaxID=3154942 RepID=UPI003451116B
MTERTDLFGSLAAIQQLPHRYARAVSSGDMDTLADLFTPDTRSVLHEISRDGSKSYLGAVLRQPRPFNRALGNHIVDFDDADHARGIVYCHGEAESVLGDRQWCMLRYRDWYVRLDGGWYFARRQCHRVSGWPSATGLAAAGPQMPMPWSDDA